MTFEEGQPCWGPPRSTTAWPPSPSRPWLWDRTRSPRFTAAMPTSPTASGVTTRDGQRPAGHQRRSPAHRRPAFRIPRHADDGGPHIRPAARSRVRRGRPATTSSSIRTAIGSASTGRCSTRPATRSRCIPQQRISIHHPYQLIVNGAGPGAVSNMSGQPLDSEVAGQPGTSDHVVLTWRQLVLGDVSRAFRIRYGLVPKGPRAKIPSGVSSPKAALGNRAGENGDARPPAVAGIAYPGTQ